MSDGSHLNTNIRPVVIKGGAEAAWSDSHRRCIVPAATQHDHHSRYLGHSAGRNTPAHPQLQPGCNNHQLHQFHCNEIRNRSYSTAVLSKCNKLDPINGKHGPGSLCPTNEPDWAHANCGNVSAGCNASQETCERNRMAARNTTYGGNGSRGNYDALQQCSYP